MKSVMKHDFSEIPKNMISRSVFNRSKGHKTAFNASDLVPILLDEVLPADTLKMSTSLFGRLTTPIVPVMDNAFLDVHYWYVPMRLLWAKWRNFMGEQPTPYDPENQNQITDLLMPELEDGAVATNSLYDHMGLPIGSHSYGATALPFRAYNLIWNEWYRSTYLQNPQPVSLGDGPDEMADYVLLRRGKRHDYFTSCLPWPQLGEDVTIPLISGSLPVYGDGNTLGLVAVAGGGGSYAPAGIGVDFGNGLVLSGPIGADQGSAYGGNLDSYQRMVAVPTESQCAAIGAAATSGLVANIDSAEVITINALREAFQLQRMLERDARGGSRYTEILRSHFNVISPDARQQRPEYLSGMTIKITTQPIAQTAPSTGSTEQTKLGNLAGYTICSGQGANFNKSFTEHGYVIGLASVRGDLTYQQGVNRLFNRKTRYDFYWPTLANLGEQEVLNKEIFADGSANDELVFGYQERYAEYRYNPSTISGALRSTSPTPLDIWHYCEEFGNLPTLSNEFITDGFQEVLDRSLAVSSDVAPQIRLDCWFDITHIRPMPVYSVPGMIDHF